MTKELVVLANGTYQISVVSLYQQLRGNEIELFVLVRDWFLKRAKVLRLQNFSTKDNDYIISMHEAILICKLEKILTNNQNCEIVISYINGFLECMTFTASQSKPVIPVKNDIVGEILLVVQQLLGNGVSGLFELKNSLLVATVFLSENGSGVYSDTVRDLANICETINDLSKKLLDYDTSYYSKSVWITDIRKAEQEQAQIQQAFIKNLCALYSNQNELMTKCIGLLEKKGLAE